MNNSIFYKDNFFQAAKTEFAAVILWDTSSWQQICCLEGHTLTVTQLAFSQSGNYLLSVSRDRTWCLYRRKSNDQPESGGYKISPNARKRVFGVSD